MARTYKDRPSKLKGDWTEDREIIRYTGTCIDYYTKEPREFTGFYYIYSKTTKPKKRKAVDTEWHWMGTPSWWNYMEHTIPRRRAARLWETKALKAIDLEELDYPNESNKPHQYFW